MKPTLYEILRDYIEEDVFIWLADKERIRCRVVAVNKRLVKLAEIYNGSIIEYIVPIDKIVRLRVY